MAAPRKDLIDQMPYWLQRDDVTGDWASFMGILQGALDSAYAILERYKLAGDVDRVDVEAIVDALLDGLGNPFDVSGFTSAQKRLLVRGLLALYRKFGTDDAAEDVVAVFTDRVVTDIIRGHVDQGWDLGVDVIGDGVQPVDPEVPTDFIMIDPGESFLIYSFMLDLDAAPTAAEEAQIAELMKVVKPIYMHYLGVHGFEPTPTFFHWEFGESEIGVTSDVH